MPSKAEQKTASHAAAMGPAHDFPVFAAKDFVVVDGANLGDALADADELCLDDIYHLGQAANPSNLSLYAPEGGPFEVAAKSAVGTAGHHIYLDCAITLMSPTGETVEGLVLAMVDPSDGALEEVLLLPFASLKAKQDYRLMGLDRDAAHARLAEVACVSFTRGTHITMADGRQFPIEDLRAGDRVLTRDNGPQTVRWMGQRTSRAMGDFAPILIKSGALNNANDLIVSANHRLFIYQRQDQLGLGRAEVLVRARDLVNGESVEVVEGGFVDYFQILFDRHEIIYAEGIAAESLPLNTRTTPVLPPELAEKLAQVIPAHADTSHAEIEVTSATLGGTDAANRLRRASRG
jgi:hypothetical protein